MRKLIFINYVGVLMLVVAAFVLVFVSIIIWWPFAVIGLVFLWMKKGFRDKEYIEEHKLDSTA